MQENRIEISSIAMKMGDFTPVQYIGGMRAYLVTVPSKYEYIYPLILRHMNGEDLLDLYMKNLYSENYEGIPRLEEEVKRRGGTITVEGNIITFANVRISGNFE